jgi:hypothetical protein
MVVLSREMEQWLQTLIAHCGSYAVFERTQRRWQQEPGADLARWVAIAAEEQRVSVPVERPLTASER